MMTNWHYIRRATPADIDTCQHIARRCDSRWNGSIGRVWRSELVTAVERCKLHVAVLHEQVVGFVLFSTPGRGENVGWNVVHTLAVYPELNGLGIGRALLYSVPTPIRLKCPATVGKGEPNPANVFYERAGLRLAGQALTRKGGALNVWQMRVLPILVQGNNKRMPEIARRAGWAYGTRATEEPQDYPIQVDIEWKDYDWSEYMQKISAWRPVAALVADYEHPEQHVTMLQQVRDLQAAGVLRVMVCPKFPGAIADIPTECIIAVSVPSSYAGFLPDFNDLRGRRVHLLGGSPPQWIGSRTNKHSATGYVSQINAAGGLVISVDGNGFTKTAARAGYWATDARWTFQPANRRKEFDLYQLAEMSARNIGVHLHELAEARQLPLMA